MQQYSILQPASRAASNSNTAKLDADTLLISGSIFIVPLLIMTSAMLYKKYRSAALQRQIVALEKMWRLELFRDA